MEKIFAVCRWDFYIAGKMDFRTFTGILTILYRVIPVNNALEFSSRIGTCEYRSGSAGMQPEIFQTVKRPLLSYKDCCSNI